MNAFIILCLFALAPACIGINCYYCLSGTTGCNDPFSSSGSGVSTTSSNTYCVKTVAAGVVARYGAAACVSIPFTTLLGYSTGTACCQTDLCNAASAKYQTPILLAVSLALIFAKFRWA